MDVSRKMRPYVRNDKYVLSFESIASLGCFDPIRSTINVHQFLEQFCGKRLYTSGGTVLIDPSAQGEVYLQWHLRFFGTGQIYEHDKLGRGILCQREISWFLDHHDKQLFRLTERRLSLCVSQTPGYPYSLVEAVDEPHYEIDKFDLRSWNGFQLKPCLPWMGVAVFQMIIRRQSEFWASSWSEVLDKLDNALRITVCGHTALITCGVTRYILIISGHQCPLEDIPTRVHVR